MQLIVLWEGIEDPIVVFVPEDSDVSLFAQLVMAETGRRLEKSHVIEFEGQPVVGGHPLIHQGIMDGSTIFIRNNVSTKSSSAAPAVPPSPVVPFSPVGPVPTQSSIPPSSTSQQQQPPATNRNVSLYDIPADVTPEQLLELSKANPQLLLQIQNNDPELGQVLASQNIGDLKFFMMKRFMNKHKQKYEKEQEIMEMERDPMNPEYQKKIEEEVS
jgi:hypothetical protein